MRNKVVEVKCFLLGFHSFADLEEVVQYPTNWEDPDFLRNFFEASLKSKEGKPLHNKFEIVQFLKKKYPTEIEVYSSYLEQQFFHF